jgi:hypothetical protein
MLDARGGWVDPGLGAYALLVPDAGDAPGWRERTHERVVLFASARELETLGPVELHVGLPGYQPLDEQVLLRPWPRRERHVLEVLPSAGGFGTLRVALLDGAGDPRRVGASPLPAGARDLDPLGGGQSLEHAIPSFALPELAIDGVPQGAYRLRWRSGSGSTGEIGHQDPPTCVVRDGAEEVVALDVGSAGAVALAIESPAGEAYAGSCVLTVVQHREGREDSLQPVAFLSPPYVLEALAPGRYTIEGRRASDARHEGLTTRVEVRSGRVQPARLVVDW